ncbi:hypothetical protein Tco_1027672, partial [Tanacetum coccineum]
MLSEAHGESQRITSGMREDLDRDGERGFDYLTFALVSSKAHRKSIGLRVVDSHTGNHPKGGFTPLETIQRLLVVIGRRSHSGFEGEAFEPGDEVMSAKDTIAMQRCGLSVKELNEFLSSYPIPLEYDVILPKSTQTIFDAPPGYVDMAFRNFIYTEDDDDLAFLPKEPSPGFGIGFPSASVNTKPPKDAEEPEVQPAEVTTDLGESLKAGVFVVHPGSVDARIIERKCKIRGGSLRPPMKRKLASGSSISHVMRAKTSTSKD